MSWPDPSATALDRARAVARTYRDALTKANPQQARILDEAAQRVGEGWVCGATTEGKACTVTEAAVMLGLSPRRVRQLIAERDLPSHQDRRGHVLLVDDVTAYARVAGARRGSALPSTADG